MLQFSPLSTDSLLCDENTQFEFEKSKDKEDYMEEVSPENTQWDSGCYGDRSSSSNGGLDQSSEEWLSNCFSDGGMQHSSDDMTTRVMSYNSEANSNDPMRQLEIFNYANGNDRPPTAIDLNKSLLKDLIFNQSPSKFGGAAYSQFTHNSEQSCDGIGCYISLPDGDLYSPKVPDMVTYKGQRFMVAANEKEESSKVVPGEDNFWDSGSLQCYDISPDTNVKWANLLVLFVMAIGYPINF
ncbi:hypothetical protein IFM89_000467 [Coptis chinensis]|uniref:Uncharacterized protein n=1 Tax=Coptis chinensis TaxID=261450 RepID=A0A835H3E2_9MAGN|nr:hypothetical protein IFM89_000467 [Coptis chinensis]